MKKRLTNLFSKQSLVKIVKAVNLSAHIANHIVGEKHTPSHQRISGVVVMFAGVVMVKIVGIAVAHNLFIHIVADVVGYGLHGIGLIPFAANLENSAKQE